MDCNDGVTMKAADKGSLAAARVLQGVPADVVAQAEDAGTWSIYEADEKICEKGDPSTDFIFLVEGSARVLINAATGQEVAFADIGAGGHFGELSLVDGGPRSATVVAAVPSQVMAVDRTYMLDLISNNAAIAINLLQDFARILRGSNDRVVDLSTKSGIQRVYDELLRLAEPSPNGDGSWYIPTIPMHKDIAVWSGTTNDTVARAIGQLTNVGIVKRRHRSLLIIDRRHIEKLANSGDTN